MLLEGAHITEPIDSLTPTVVHQIFGYILSKYTMEVNNTNTLSGDSRVDIKFKDHELIFLVDKDYRVYVYSNKNIPGVVTVMEHNISYDRVHLSHGVTVTRVYGRDTMSTLNTWYELVAWLRLRYVALRHPTTIDIISAIRNSKFIFDRPPYLPTAEHLTECGVLTTRKYPLHTIETIDEGLRRIRVNKGWLYQSYRWSGAENVLVMVSSDFVPD